jgi:nitrile hydratase
VHGVHDLGGAYGFGRVPTSEGGSFHSDWERRVFGIQLQLIARGIPRSLDELRYTLEQLEPELFLAAGYFERWLLANERLVVAAGVVDAQELYARQRAVAQMLESQLPSNPDADFADAVAATIVTSKRVSVDGAPPPRFGVGAGVRTRNHHRGGHTRLARYAQGRRGSIARVYDAFTLPDASAFGDTRAEHVYAVRFDARELWGDAADPNSSVCIDLWESYLETDERA